MLEVIRCRGLGKRYGSTVAVEGLDLTVQAGQVFGFLGRNGAGKKPRPCGCCSASSGPRKGRHG